MSTILMTSDPYKPPKKTVVTQIRHFIVDTSRRIGAGRFSVSAGSNENTLTQTEVVVSSENPYELKDVHSVVSISCPSPIYAEFVAFGEIPEPERRVEQLYFDAVISADDVYAGMFLEITVEDLDCYANAIEVTVQNARTYETETINIASVGRGIFRGILQTRESMATGADFDGVMHCMPLDSLEISYNEPHNAAGQTERRILDVICKAYPHKYTSIEVASSVPVGKDLNFKIENGGNPVSIRNTRTGYIIHQPFPAPILLQDTDSMTSLAVQAGDIVEISTFGLTVNGEQTITKTLVVGNDNAPTISGDSQVTFGQKLTLTIKDNSMNGVSILVNGVSIQAVSTFYNSGLYKAEFDVVRTLGALPGEYLNIQYGALNKSVLVQPVDVMACPEISVPDTGISDPVTFKIKDHFFLNGSFAGTIKLWADEPTRVTLLKS